jgi:N-acetylglutamate synthase-like GNAT family acetyltransferase
VTSGFDPGALLARSYALPRGPRVTLRLARVRDLEQIAQLLDRQGIDLDELELVRLVRFDPRVRQVICATALVDARELVIGIGAIELDGRRSTPTLVVADEAISDGLSDLISDALVGRARTLATVRAA